MKSMMGSSSTSAQEPQQNHLVAPPPTPSTRSSETPTTTVDALTHLLHRLPPTLSLSLSLPTRHRSNTFPPPPIISLSNDDDPTALLSAATKLGYFHLTHPLPPPPSASTVLSLFDLPHSDKQLLFPNNNWPLGYDDEFVESFCLALNPSSSSLELDSLREFGREMEKVGLKVVEELAAAVGLKNPDRDQLCSLLWISTSLSSDIDDKPGRVYPYVVGLHCQLMSCGDKYTYLLLSDSGWVNVVSGRVDNSVLVTVGDISQVWSNGKLKKVRGRPVPNSRDDNNNKSRCITISLLITLPVESIVSPLLPNLAPDAPEEQQKDEINNGTDSNCAIGIREHSQFRSFAFEDYAWRVYHERLLLKDPLLRYRV